MKAILYYRFSNKVKPADAANKVGLLIKAKYPNHEGKVPLTIYRHGDPDNLGELTRTQEIVIKAVVSA